LQLRDGSKEKDLDGLGLLAMCKVQKIPSIVVSANTSSYKPEYLHDTYGVYQSFDKANFSIHEFINTVNLLLGYKEPDTQKPMRSFQEIDELTFRTKWQILIDVSTDSYRKANQIINEMHRERMTLRGKYSDKDEEIFRQQLFNLDKAYKEQLELIRQATKLEDLNFLHPQILKDCSRWMAGLAL